MLAKLYGALNVMFYICNYINYVNSKMVEFLCLSGGNSTLVAMDYTYNALVI